MNDPTDEIPLPSLPVLSEEESARQIRADSVRQYTDEINRLHGKDSVKTREINVLVAENRALIADGNKLIQLLARTMGVLSEFGQITDQSHVGWLMQEINSALAEHAHPNAEDVRDLLISLRGNPSKCDFCGKPKSVEELIPEEGGDWICAPCLKRCEENEKRAN